MKNDADAEEAFSRASLLIYLHLKEHGDTLENPRAWLLRLAFNVCMSLHREVRRRAEQSLEELEPDAWSDPPPVRPMPGGDPEGFYLRKELKGFLRSSIAGLPERLRETMLGHLSLSSHREVADRLSINETNVRKRMQEARAILSHQLAEYRSGRARMPLRQPRAATGEAAGESAPGGPLREIRALRSATALCASGGWKEGLLALRHTPSANPARTREKLERYVARHPRGWKRRLDLARTLLEEGRVREAACHLESVVHGQPRQIEAWLALISAYRFLERPEAAAAACERALAASKHGVTAMLHGLRAQCLGRSAEAERLFAEAGEMAPESPAPRVALAEVHLAAGRPAEALDSLDAALAIAPDDVAALTLGHEALRLSGRSSEARRRTGRTLEIDGANPPALERWLAARSRAAGGGIEPGSARWQQAEGLARTRPATLSLLACLRARGGDLGGVEEVALLVRERPRFRQARAEYARLLDELGHPKPALQELDVARTLHPSCRGLDLLACRLAARAGLPQRMLHELDAALVRHGDLWDVAATAAWVLAQLGMEGRALDLACVAVERQPRLPAAWIEYGQVLARFGRLREAVAAGETAWSLLPAGDGLDLAVPAALGLAAVHRRLGDAGASRSWAGRTLEACAALEPADPARARIFRARALVELGGAAAVSPPQAGEHRIFTTQLSEASLG